MRRHSLHSLVDPGFSARLGRGTAIASSATAASTVALQVRKSLADSSGPETGINAQKSPVSRDNGLEVGLMTKDHGSSVKDDKQYEGLRKKGMSKERAAKIANTPGASKKGGKTTTGGRGRGSKEGQRKGGRKRGKKS